MQESLRRFYGRCIDAAALAFSILASLLFFAAIVSIVIMLTSNAQAQTAASRAAIATTPPLNDGLPEPGFDITTDDTAIVITDP